MSNWSNDTKRIVDEMSKEERERFEAIRSMHSLVCLMNDERAYLEWIYLVPDCADENDFIDFAINDDGTKENQMFTEAVGLFKRLWKKYASVDNGLYIGGKTF